MLKLRNPYLIILLIVTICVSIGIFLIVPITGVPGIEPIDTSELSLGPITDNTLACNLSVPHTVYDGEYYNLFINTGQEERMWCEINYIIPPDTLVHNSQDIIYSGDINVKFPITYAQFFAEGAYFHDCLLCDAGFMGAGRGGERAIRMI